MHDEVLMQGVPYAVEVGELPRNWERAFGYDGTARYLAAWWEPAGDEARYSDGLITADGQWHIFLDLVDERLFFTIARALACDPRGRWALGSSEEPATHCLLLDCLQRAVYVAPLQQARQFLREQSSGRPTVWLTPQELTGFVAELQTALRVEMLHSLRGYQACSNGCNMGWFVADDGGYDACPACGGKWLRPAG